MTIRTKTGCAGRLLCLCVLAVSADTELSAQTDAAARAARSNDDRSDQSSLGIPGIPEQRGYGGPNTVPSQLQGDLTDGPRFRAPWIDETLQPWLDFKARLVKEHRFQLGADYNTLYQGASETLTGNDDAASGIARVFADWTLFGEDEKSTGSLIAKGEHRHRFGTQITPSAIGFDAGYLGIPGTLFTDGGWGLTNLYWEQVLCDGQAAVVVGLLEPDSFIDVSGYANPWTTFQNFAVLVNPTIPFPDPTFGAAAGVSFNDQWVVKGGIYDPNNVYSDFEFFGEGGEFLTHVDVSWAPTRAERYLKEIHVSGWHVDKRRNAGVPESWGVAFAANWTFGERWMPFVRGGWADGGAPLMHRALTGGFLYYCADRGDLTGFAMTWEDPSDRSLRDQTSIEYFYRLQLAKHFAITPSVQVLIDPSQNPGDDAITIFGVRTRLTL